MRYALYITNGTAFITIQVVAKVMDSKGISFSSKKYLAVEGA